LEVRDLEVNYNQVRAVRGISFEVPAAAAVGLIGANGAGKSSTLSALAGLIRPRAGTVRFAGEDVTGWRTDKLVAHGLVLVPEGRQILAQMTVAENLMLGAYHRRDRVQARAEIEATYRRFPVLGQRRRLAGGSLSGGEQQILAVARGLLAHPRLLMLDEPSMGLAPQLVDELFAILREILDAGTSILLVEQNARKALHLTSHSYVLQTGRIVLKGSSNDLIRDESLVAAYLGTSRIEEEPGRIGA